MTELLAQAIAKLKTLPTNEQNAMAAMILEELEEERLRDEAFCCSKDKLAILAAQATADYYAGKTEELETLTEKLDTKDEMYP